MNPETISHKDLAAVFIFLDLKTNKVLMEKRLDNQSFSGLEIFPGGHIEEDEVDDLRKTIVRELKEEFGVSPTTFYFMDTGDDIVGETGKIIRPFVIVDWDGRISERSLDKRNLLVWVSLDEALSSKLKSTREMAQALLIWLA